MCIHVLKISETLLQRGHMLMFRTLSRRSVLAVMMAPALAEPATIEVASWKGNEAEPAGMAQLIAKFEAENPGIKVNLVYVSRNDTDTVVSPRMPGGQSA